MRTETRSLGLGLAAGMALAASVLLLGYLFRSVPAPAGAQYASLTPNAVRATETPVPEPSTVPSFTPIAETTLMPNVAQGLDLAATPTPNSLAELIAAGGLAYSGALPPEQQVALYQASAKYVQSSVEDSKRAAKQINQVGYGDPTNICGPLAIAILQDAHIVPSYISPHDYWLLDPSKAPDKRLIQNAFPENLFNHVIITTPLNKVDWREMPLEPGDFLFIWHGSGGNFDHMLVVNRMDAQGRAYAVTNFGTPAGYMIAETMLYDPQDANAGIFHTWTRERDAILGSTGFGGFEIWRLRNP